MGDDVIECLISKAEGGMIRSGDFGALYLYLCALGHRLHQAV